jgi:hypothetical protein
MFVVVVVVVKSFAKNEATNKHSTSALEGFTGVHQLSLSTHPQRYACELSSMKIYVSLGASLRITVRDLSKEGETYEGNIQHRKNRRTFRSRWRHRIWDRLSGTLCARDTIWLCGVEIVTLG